MEMSETRSTSLPRRIAWVVAFFYVGCALIPYAIVGESWGMLWFYLTAPVSMAVETTLGIGKESYLLIVFTSLACAAGWAAVAYTLTKLIQRWR